MKIVVVNGKPTSGKSTFESLCMGLGRAHCYGEKTPENRKFLSDLKDLLTTWDDIPMKKVQEKIQQIQESFTCGGSLADRVVLFVDVREPKEIQRLKEMYGATTLLIRRASVEFEETSNHADSEVLNYQYDVIIENNGTIDELREKAVDFLASLFEDSAHA